MKSNKLLIYIILLFLLISIIFNIIYFNKYNNISNRKIDSIVRVDTFIDVDTVTYYYPKPVKVEVKDTIYLHSDSIKQEGDSILLPREEKTYTDDSTYNVRISGYKPSLDEISVYPKTTYIVTEKVLEIEKKRKFNIGLQVGSGYGIFTKQPDLYVGIGFQYNLW